MAHYSPGILRQDLLSFTCIHKLNHVSLRLTSKTLNPSIAFS